MDKHYPREEAFVLQLMEKLKLRLAKCPQNPNSDTFESGADVAVVLTDDRLIGVQVTEVDPFPEPGARGREKVQERKSASGVYGNFAQNDTKAVLDAICCSIGKKTSTTPIRSRFDEVWLLLCTGVPDAPISTFIPTPPLSAYDLDARTRSQLLQSMYDECFILPFFDTEHALYRWSRRGADGWKKSVFLEDIPEGAGDAEYVRELLRTHGKDKSVVKAQMKRILDELRKRSG